jgi:predicted RNase H-like HicB family nuclease
LLTARSRGEYNPIQTISETIMLTEYVQAAMKKAKYEILQDDGSYYGEIPGFKGVYANTTTLEECRNELREVLEDWILVGISSHSTLPVVDGIELKVKEAV